MKKYDTHVNKEELLIQAVKTQHSILQLLDNTLLETYQSEKSLPIEEQNEELINLAYRVRSVIAKKPKLKQIYTELEEKHGIDFSN